MPVFDLAECLPELEAQFTAQPDVLLVYVFGSQAKGKAHARSDLDVAVLLVGDPDGATCTQRRLDMIGDLMSLFHTNDVDVVVLNQADLVLRYQVVQYGRLAYAREHNIGVEFRVRTLNLYFDFAPFLIRMEQAFYQRIREGRFLDGYNPYHGTPFPDPAFPASFARTTAGKP
ncbi:MAG: nucleotidyltransferase domain-containing protein [Chloroflexota bacterium]|nr:nucleotidyltransferase domain-containing protein [Chloroflexota bacterium]